MPAAIKNADAYMGKGDLYKVDPLTIKIMPDFNPRQGIGDLTELKESIRANGFYRDKPLLLHQRGADLFVVSGHRRLQACLELIKEGVRIFSVPAVLEQEADPAVLLARALAANQNSEPLGSMDEARAFKKLQGYGWEPKQIAANVGRSVSHVYGRLKLLEALPEVLAAQARGEITQTDVVRVVEKAGKAGVSQGEVLTEKVRERQKKQQAPKPLGGDGEDRGLQRDLLDVRGVAWVVEQLLDYADKEEVLDAIHDLAAR